jgi:flagellar motor switch protein FliG
MPPDDDQAPAPKKPMSLAEALKEGVKGASGQITDVSQLDGPSKCAVVLLTVGAELGSEVLEDRSLQALMLEVPQDMLVTALKGSSGRLRDKLFKNMAKRAAEAVKESLDSRGPVKITEVEETQKEMLRTARQLTDEGRMSMDRGGGGSDMI